MKRDGGGIIVLLLMVLSNIADDVSYECFLRFMQLIVSIILFKAVFWCLSRSHDMLVQESGAQCASSMEVEQRSPRAWVSSRASVRGGPIFSDPSRECLLSPNLAFGDH